MAEVIQSNDNHVLVADDHYIVYYGIRKLLEKHPTISSIEYAPSPSETVTKVKVAPPDILILDLVFGGRDGLELLKTIRTLSTKTKILIYSAYKESVYGPNCIRMGARGFVNKSEDGSEFIEAFGKVEAGHLHLSLNLQRLLFDQADAVKNNNNEGLKTLSPGELRVLQRIGAGHRSALIAEDLSISVKTVSSYKERLKNKLNVASSYELEKAAQQYLEGL